MNTSREAASKLSPIPVTVAAATAVLGVFLSLFAGTRLCEVASVCSLLTVVATVAVVGV
jgi:protein-S-isoprenylcysteine O-methyltransferase Ste14